MHLIRPPVIISQVYVNAHLIGEKIHILGYGENMCFNFQWKWRKALQQNLWLWNESLNTENQMNNHFILKHWKFCYPSGYHHHSPPDCLFFSKTVGDADVLVLLLLFNLFPRCQKSTTTSARTKQLQQVSLWSALYLICAHCLFWQRAHHGDTHILMGAVLLVSFFSQRIKVWS